MSVVSQTFPSLYQIDQLLPYGGDLQRSLRIAKNSQITIRSYAQSEIKENAFFLTLTGEPAVGFNGECSQDLVGPFVELLGHSISFNPDDGVGLAKLDPSTNDDDHNVTIRLLRSHKRGFKEDDAQGQTPFRANDYVTRTFLNKDSVSWTKTNRHCVSDKGVVKLYSVTDPESLRDPVRRLSPFSRKSDKLSSAPLSSRTGIHFKTLAVFELPKMEKVSITINFMAQVMLAFNGGLTHHKKEDPYGEYLWWTKTKHSFSHTLTIDTSKESIVWSDPMLERHTSTFGFSHKDSYKTEDWVTVDGKGNVVKD